MNETEALSVKEFVSAIAYNFKNKNKKNCLLGYTTLYKAKYLTDIEKSQNLVNRIKNLKEIKNTKQQFKISLSN